jgi:hypothetical protein
MEIQPRSVFSTGTVKSAFWGFGLTAVAIAIPYISTIAQRYAPDKATKDTYADIAGLLTAVFGATGIIGGAGAVVVNRATVDSKEIVYSPSLVPGLSKDDAISCAKKLTTEALRATHVEAYIKDGVPLTQIPAVKSQIAQQVAAVMPDMHEQVANALSAQQRVETELDRMHAVRTAIVTGGLLASTGDAPALQPERFLA